MKKISFKQIKPLNWLKKYYSFSIIILLILALAYNLFFIFTMIRNKAIDPNSIISREQKVNQKSYDSVIAKDQMRKNSTLDVTKLQNPF